MDNLRGLLGIRRMDKVPSGEIRELCEVMKGVNEKIECSPVVQPYGENGEIQGLCRVVCK